MELHGLLVCCVALCFTAALAAGELRYGGGQGVGGKGQYLGGKEQDLAGNGQYLGSKEQDVGGKGQYLGSKGQEVGSEGKGEGWLSRLVSYYKRSFLSELQQLAPIHLQASIKKAPAGYMDSTAWDFESVARLLGLLRADEDSKPVRVALRRALRPSGPARRFMSRHKSYKYFPSLQAMHHSNFYYDMYDEDVSSSKEDASSNTEDSSEVDEDAVLQIQNPVEARLPSASISIRLLKAILEARAKAARKMPPTKTTPKHTWKTTDMSVTTTATSASNNTSTLTSSSNGETTPDAETSTLPASTALPGNTSSVEPTGDTTTTTKPTT